MKQLLIVLCTTVLSSSTITTLTTQINNYQTSNTKILRSENNKYQNQINTFEQIIRNKSLEEQKALHINLNYLLFIKDEKISMDITTPYMGFGSN